MSDDLLAVANAVVLLVFLAIEFVKGSKRWGRMMDDNEMPMFHTPEHHQVEGEKARQREADAVAMAQAAIRNRALEDAAKEAEKTVLEEQGALDIAVTRYRTWDEIAAAIRGLKTHSV